MIDLLKIAINYAENSLNIGFFTVPVILGFAVFVFKWSIKKVIKLALVLLIILSFLKFPLLSFIKNYLNNIQ